MAGAVLLLLALVVLLIGLKYLLTNAKAIALPQLEQNAVAPIFVQPDHASFNSRTGSMDYEEHLEVAYWSVMANLKSDEIPLELLRELCPKFLAAVASNHRTAVDLLLETLKDYEWDFPEWHALPKSSREMSRGEVTEWANRIRPRTLLEEATKPSLELICKQHEIYVPSKAKKAEVISALLKSLTPAALDLAILPIREKMAAAAMIASRRDIADFICGRISSIGHNANHYEQLSDPEYVALCPFWKFIWVDHFGDAPKSCKKFDGKILPVEKAKRIFPHLPCKRRNCHCRVTSSSTKEG
jgi:hypothetical protein